MTNDAVFTHDILTVWENAIRSNLDAYFASFPERTLSLPIPIIREQKKMISYFVHETSILTDLTTSSEFPSMIVYADYPAITGLITADIPEDWHDLAGVFPVVHRPQGRDPYVARTKRHQFSAIYQSVVNFFPAQNPAPLSARFLQLFDYFTSLPMTSLYQRMNPEFWRWLRTDDNGEGDL